MQSATWHRLSLGQFLQNHAAKKDSEKNTASEYELWSVFLAELETRPMTLLPARKTLFLGVTSVW